MSAEPKPPIFPESVELNKAQIHKGISILIFERMEQKQFPRGRSFILSYRLRDSSLTPTFESPVAHLFAREREDIRPQIEKVVESYLKMKEAGLMWSTPSR